LYLRAFATKPLVRLACCSNDIAYIPHEWRASFGGLLFHAATVNTVAAATNSRSHVNLNCANPTLWQVAGAGHWRTNSASAGLCRRQIIS
jgi:hypothetical protein